MELELKKNDAKITEIEDDIHTGFKMAASFADETKNEFNEIKEKNKKLKYAIITGIAISIATLAAVFIGFFI